jgi:hypothetical protein
VVALAIGMTAGCGGSDESSSEPPPSTRIELSAGAAPSAEQCGFAELKADATGEPRNSAPQPGVYEYASTVTPSTKRAGVTCFGSEHRYTDRVRTANVYILRGEDIYIVADGFDTPNFVQTVLPRPAILALSGTQEQWSGTFAGATSGTYSVEIVGRRAFTIGGRKVKTVGLSSRATFKGETEGSQQRETWLAVDRAIVVREKGTSVLRLGGDTERLSYTSTLKSLTPEAGGG